MPNAREPNPNDSQTRPNTLGMNSKKLDEVLDILDRGGAADPSSTVSRADARWPFRQPSVRVRVVHPGGTEVELRMACRNLSRNGAGLLHSAFLYPGTRCVLNLPHPDEGESAVGGSIVRCQHRTGILHEIGVKFDAEIDLRGFVRPDPMREWFSVEHIDPERLIGSVLYIDPNQLDAQLVRHFLRDTQVRLRVAATVEDAMTAARRGVDLILCEYRLEGLTGGDLVARLRGEHIDTPVIVTSMDQDPRITALLERKMAQAFLSKPIVQHRLIRAFGEFLTPRSGQARAASVDQALLQSMKPELARCASVIEEGIRKCSAMDVLSVCLQLRGVAPSIGMGDLSRDLDEIVVQLSASMNLTPCTTALTRIAERCRTAA